LREVWLSRARSLRRARLALHCMIDRMPFNGGAKSIGLQHVRAEARKAT
jgi:hypothetical protein